MTGFEDLNLKILMILDYFNIYVQFQFHAQLS